MAKPHKTDMESQVLQGPQLTRHAHPTPPACQDVSLANNKKVSKGANEKIWKVAGGGRRGTNELCHTSDNLSKERESVLTPHSILFSFRQG